MIKSKLGLTLLVAVFTIGCGHDKQQAERRAQPPQESDLEFGLTKEQSARVLVKLRARIVTLGQFAERLGGQPPYFTARYNSPERRREFLDEMVRFELMAAEAEKRGYDRRGDVERVKKQMMVEQMMQELFEKQGVKLSDISDAEIQRYYADHKDEFEAQNRTAADARGVIQNRLWRKQREAAIEKFVADLRSKAGIQENAALLSKVHVESEAPSAAQPKPAATKK